MRSVRILSWLLLFAAAGCRDARVLGANGELRVQPERLDFPTAWVGHRVTAAVILQNAGRRSIEVQLVTDAPFDVTVLVAVPGGETVSVDVGVLGRAAGSLDGVLVASAEGKQLAIPLHAEVQVPAVCAASACHVAAFDVVTGTCVEVIADDGASCGGDDACLVDGACRAGQCIGRALDCDDGNACTTDSCVPQVGCRHVEAACAPATDPCRVSFCDAVAGCSTAPALDGIACGPNDCSNAKVCIAGACVSRPSPDGSQCAQPTSCRGAGTCVNQVCEKPAPRLLQPAWSHTVGPEHDFVFGGHVDNDGNIYAVESYVVSDSGEVDVLVTELVSFSPFSVERFRVRIATDCTSCRYSMEFALDTAGRRAFMLVRGQLVARSLDDGALLWSVSPSLGLPAYEPRADGGGAFSVMSVLLVGDTGVGVPIMEGLSDHHAYVRVFDRATGNFLWEIHRKGHLYGTGVSGDGELWTSAANCWAPSGDLARVGQGGVTRRSRFIEWMPQVYGEAFALGGANGGAAHVDGTMVLRDLSPALGNARTWAAPLVVGERAVFFDRIRHVMSSVDLSTGVGAPVAATEGITDAQLLRDGGIAWVGATVVGGYIRAVDGAGAELFSCPVSFAPEGAMAIVGGRLVARSGTALVVYETPGLDAEPNGWSADRGSPERSRRAR